MEKIKEMIAEAIREETSLEVITLEIPPKDDMGDFAFPCFTLSKTFKKSPHDIAKELEPKISRKLAPSVAVKVIGPYLNFFIDRKKMAESIEFTFVLTNCMIIATAESLERASH